MMQSFVVLSELIKQFIDLGLANYESCPSIAICTTKTHAFVLINSSIVCDPWPNYIDELTKTPYNKEQIQYYFRIHNDWQCFNDRTQLDCESTAYTFKLFDMQNKSSTSAVFFKQAIETPKEQTRTILEPRLH
ncbi:MAG: hypothetical protein PSV35_02010 [bacterium]|nr:hypothetical protein [bacterium]